MLRRSSTCLENFREHYHRLHLPRRIALQRYVAREERKRSVSPKAPTGGAAATVPYKYNRWWVNNDHAFVHQYAVVEDPQVTQEKRTRLPTATSENIWKNPQSTFFLPFAPFIKVVDYPKDPDSKFLKPVNVPRWKDYMNRSKPVVPRTWY
jgi:hypothetical protein